MIFFREIGSIYRCDGTLVLSDFELHLLKSQFGISEELLFLSRFHYPKPVPTPDFGERHGFAMIGNFRHPPNRDGILWLREKIWPLMRAMLPEAEVQIYGAYPPKDMMQLHAPEIGFCVMGPVEDAHQALKKHRVSLAPLRFGAGIKGKITDGWFSGTPVVTTPVGAEGMSGDLPWGGAVEATPEGFAKEAIALYQDRELWQRSRQRGAQILRELYSAEKNSEALVVYLKTLARDRDRLRGANWIGHLLSFHAYRSTKYFSRWIEEKNKPQDKRAGTQSSDPNFSNTGNPLESKGVIKTLLL